MIHSFEVMRVGVGSPRLDCMFWTLFVLIARVGGAGARFIGEPADEAVDTAGLAMALSGFLGYSSNIGYRSQDASEATIEVSISLVGSG